MQRRTFLRPDRWLRSEWSSDRFYDENKLDSSWLAPTRYIVTCKTSNSLRNRFTALPFPTINLGVFCGFWENKFYFSEKFSGAVIPDVIDVAEMNDFNLSRDWYDWVAQDPFQGARRHYGKKDEQHGFGEPSKVEKANTSDPTSASINSSTSKSIDIGTSEMIDTKFYHRSIPLEIPERSSCPQDIADSTHKSTDVSSCSPSPDVEKEITMEDFLELEEFLELEDGEKLGDLDSSRAVTMEDFLELEE
ncbi:hypothetical protein F2Q68_00005176 [Brassica cretica]|uniref:Uncharacterized protein n=1 Tax=Brassica cretica TaxID=69181 RepID=A0A8S9JCD9_BRACR|nr:hypothetical protein F2Q68_00005176 [Brassica cretica]